MLKSLAPAVLAVLFLQSCVSDSTQMPDPPGRYDSYYDLLITIGGYAKFPSGAPQSVRDRYAKCAADFVIANTPPADLPKLDAYARGQGGLTVGESRRMDQALAARAGGPITDGGLERLTPYCPEDVPDLLRWPPSDS
jgi:hypothetical protein